MTERYRVVETMDSDNEQYLTDETPRAVDGERVYVLEAIDNE